jgi:uncharacterized protein YkwD
VSSPRDRRAAAATTICLGLLASAFASVAAQAPTAAGEAAVPQTKPRGLAAALSPYERDLLARINMLRARRDLVRLIPSAGLMGAAEAHTRRMVREGFFEHELPGERPFWRRIERFYPSRGYGYWAVGENLAYGSPSLEPAEVVRDWLGSPKHRRSLLTAEWRDAGLAAVHVAAAPGEFEGAPSTVVTLDLGVRRN